MYQLDRRYIRFFKYVFQNSKAKLTSVDGTEVYLARLEDALMCKACANRPKDRVGLSSGLPFLVGLRRLDLHYVKIVAHKYGVLQQVQSAFADAGIALS